MIVHPSCKLSCATALWLALGGLVHAQIGGVAPDEPQRAPAAQRNARQPVQPAAHQEVLPAAPSIEIPTADGGMTYLDGEEPMYTDGWGPGCGPMGCSFCGQRGPGCGPLGNGCFSGVYFRAEYMLWGTSGANLPPLVTTSPQGTAQANAGVLGLDTTTILFGGDDVGDDVRSGARLYIGWWFDPCRRLGVEWEGFALDDERSAFEETSSGNPILARPFFDVVQGIQNVNLVAFPNVIRGTLAASHETGFHGAGVRAMYNLACGEGGGKSWFTGCPVHTGFRYDALLGYRYVQLDDRVVIVDNSVSLDPQNPGSFIVNDSFDTENRFHGVDFGSSISFCKGCFSVELLSKIALGNNHAITTIDGSTVITQGAVAQNFQGGLLAQRTNIGTFEDDQFAVVPELGITLGYQINPCWRATVGYTFIYWSQVARAGDQIDLRVNPNIIPPEGPPPVTTNLFPQFNWVYDDYWAQGFNFGIEGRW
jgi:hypothetical protein